MKTKQHAQFKRGDEVTWVSQAGGYSKKKRGKVVEVVKAGEYPTGWHKMHKPGIRRNHRSYRVKVGNTLYWPLVKNLKPVKGRAS